jgi:hypothetical protein
VAGFGLRFYLEDLPSFQKLDPSFDMFGISPTGDPPQVVRWIALLFTIGALLTCAGFAYAFADALWSGKTTYSSGRFMPVEEVSKVSSPEKFDTSVKKWAFFSVLAGGTGLISLSFYGKLSD